MFCILISKVISVISGLRVLRLSPAEQPSIVLIHVEAFYLGLVRLACFSTSGDSTASQVRI